MSDSTVSGNRNMFERVESRPTRLPRHVIAVGVRMNVPVPKVTYCGADALPRMILAKVVSIAQKRKGMKAEKKKEEREGCHIQSYCIAARGRS